MATEQIDSDDGMDEFMDAFKTKKYKQGFSESNWEEVKILCRNCHLATFVRILFLCNLRCLTCGQANNKLTSIILAGHVQPCNGDRFVLILFQEFNKVPMFMKTAPDEIDPRQYPELACLQSILHDEDRSPEGNTAAPQLYICIIPNL